MKIVKNIVFISIVCILIILSFGQVSKAADTYYQYVKTGIDQFPASYQERLQQLASKYPNWKFQAYYTGISWDELIQNERDENVHRNRVTNNAPKSWKNSCGYVYDGYACASDAIVAYYLDPRNFLNETQIFQFVESSYNPDVQTLAAIQESVKGTFLDATITCNDLNNNLVTMSYAEMIIKAAQESNISAFYIKSKIIQEVGSQGSGSVSGTYPGYEGYYNFYNFGAYDTGDPIANGLLYAKDKGWDSPYKAIVDGASLIGKNYIEAGQNTAYFNKWDVVGTKILRDGESQTVNKSDMFWHQYMTNIQDPTSQSYSNYELYSNSLQSEITFIIPVYDNMPASNPMPQDVPVQGITMQQDSFVVNIDETGDAIPIITPSNATEQSVEWTSSDPEVVRVWNGHFRGLKEGTSVLTAKTIDGGYTATCTVTVLDPNKQYVSDIQFEQDEYIIQIDEAIDIPFTYTPEDSVNYEFDWISSDSEVLRVYNNRFRGLKEGTAEVIVRTRFGPTVEKRIKVIVRDPNKNYVENIWIESSQYVVKEDEAVDVNFSFTPADSVNAEFEWYSTNPEVLRVYNNRFRGLKEGTAQIVVKTLDGTVATSSNVTVEKPYVEDIQFEQTEYTVDINEALYIPFTYSPENACNYEFDWISSDPETVRVYNNYFRGLKEGTAEIIVRTRFGPTIEKRIKVNVVDYSKATVEDIVLDKTSYIVNIDEAVDIPFSWTPEYASNAEFDWISSDSEVLRVYNNRFRALKEGTAEVIVRTRDGSLEERIKVVVRDPNKTYVTDIQLPQMEYTIYETQAVDIPFTYNPTNAVNAEFEWYSTNPEVLRVYNNRFRGLKEGTAEVVVRTLDGTYEERITVNVKPSGLVQEIILGQTEYTVKEDEAVDINDFSWTPQYATNAEFEWFSTDPEIVRVYNNRFRGLKKGNAEVVVRTLDQSIERRIKVTVE